MFFLPVRTAVEARSLALTASFAPLRLPADEHQIHALREMQVGVRWFGMERRGLIKGKDTNVT